MNLGPYWKIGWRNWVLVVCVASVGCKDRNVELREPEKTTASETELTQAPSVHDVPDSPPVPSVLDKLRILRAELRDNHALTLMFFGQVEKSVKGGYRIQWCDGERCAPSSLTLVSTESLEPGQKIGLRIRYLEDGKVEAITTTPDERVHSGFQAARLEAEELQQTETQPEQWLRVVELVCSIRAIPPSMCKTELAVSRRAMLRRADAHEMLGNYKNADDEYQRALLFDPSHLGLEQVIRFYVTAPEPYRDTYLAEGLLRRLEVVEQSPIVTKSARIELFLQLNDVESAKAVLSLNSEKELDAYRDRFKRGDFAPLVRPQAILEMASPPTGELTLDERLVVIERLVSDELLGHPDVPELYDLLQELATQPELRSLFAERKAREIHAAPVTKMLPRLP